MEIPIHPIHTVEALRVQSGVLAQGVLLGQDCHTPWDRIQVEDFLEGRLLILPTIISIAIVVEFKCRLEIPRSRPLVF